MGMNTPTHVPKVTFKTHTRDRNICGVKPFAWVEQTADDIFKGPSNSSGQARKIVLFALPGAFTPTCSSQHLPGYEKMYDEFKKLGIDEVYCLSVNDAFVMNAWQKDQRISKVKLIPDGTAEFTKAMGMLVKKNNLGFGERSWRYSMYVEDGEIKKIFVEPGLTDDYGPDPFEVSDADTMLNYLRTC